MLNPGVVLSAVVAQHYERVRPNNAIQEEGCGSREKRGGVPIPVLGLYLVLLVVATSFLEIHDHGDVSFFESGNHLIVGCSL